MTGKIPKYGTHFRRVSVHRDFDRNLAQTLYELKANPRWHIRANGNSEKWWVFYSTMRETIKFPQTHSVMRDAMTACVEANLILSESE